MLIQIAFEGFEFHPRTTKTGSVLHNKCVEESVEIRLGDQFKGNFFCGTDIKEGTVMTSTGSQATILIYANDLMIGKGLRAKVRFIQKATKSSIQHRVVGEDDEQQGFQPLQILANIFGLISNSINAIRIG